jgi:hypothetical protein
LISRLAAMTPEELEAFRKSIRERLAAERERRAVPSGQAPRYDAVYFEGMRWLDSLR